MEVSIPACVEVEYQNKVTIAVTLADKEQISEIVVYAEAYAGGWPDELPRDIFDKLDFGKLLNELKRYRDMVPHPGYSFQVHPNKPVYQIIDGKICRGGNPLEDIKLVKTAQMLSGSDVRMFGQEDFQRIFNLAFQMIQYYGQMRLAKFLFLLPKARDDYETLSKGEKSKAIVVAEYLRIDVYNGVENILFEIYQELPRGETFDDTTVTHKLLSIVESAKTQ